ncbi:TorF family putative porin [Pelagicoccus albus]|uniref:Uncharacterized protein n=1 Tax=Pelagicoccus albus TaxID=415222 RepID=A0A7X1B7W5_9BACT|nr:TorF family putative porin [Pelagicoccus albus]MBC2607187.1 hypothetical protein [Pelagicoccus albus]
MKLKRLSPTTVSFLSIVLSAPYCDADVYAEAVVSSLYVDRGLQAADLTVFPSIEFSEGDFYAGAWAVRPLENRGSPDFFDDELDLYAGYGWALSRKIALDVGLTRHFVSGDDDSSEAHAGIFAELGTVSPSLYLFHDFDLSESAAELSATVAVPLEGFPFEATGTLGYFDGDEDYSYFGLDLIYPIELSDASRLSFGLHYASNDFGALVPDSSLFGSASISFGF